MVIYSGTAKFTWNAGANEHLLAVPLQQVKPAHRRNRYVAESLDFSSRVVTSVGAGVYEVRGKIRYDGDPDSLLELLIEGVDGGTLRYYPDFTGDPGTFWDVVLVEPTTINEVLFDVEQERFDEHTIEITLRREDGGTFAGVW